MGLLGCIVWWNTRDDQLSHEDQALEIILRVAAMVAVAVLLAVYAVYKLFFQRKDKHPDDHDN